MSGSHEGAKAVEDHHIDAGLEPGKESRSALRRITFFVSPISYLQVKDPTAGDGFNRVLIHVAKSGTSTFRSPWWPCQDDARAGCTTWRLAWTPPVRVSPCYEASELRSKEGRTIGDVHAVIKLS